jgi:hypothetical protein
MEVTINLPAFNLQNQQICVKVGIENQYINSIHAMREDLNILKVSQNSPLYKNIYGANDGLCTVLLIAAKSDFSL